MHVHPNTNLPNIGRSNQIYRKCIINNCPKYWTDVPFPFFLYVYTTQCKIHVLVTQKRQTFPVRNIITVSLWGNIIRLPALFTMHFQNVLKINFLDICKHSRENNVNLFFKLGSLNTASYNYWRVKIMGILFIARGVIICCSKMTGGVKIAAIF